MTVTVTTLGKTLSDMGVQAALQPVVVAALRCLLASRQQPGQEFEHGEGADRVKILCMAVTGTKVPRLESCSIGARRLTRLGGGEGDGNPNATTANFLVAAVVGLSLEVAGVIAKKVTSVLAQVAEMEAVARQAAEVEGEEMEAEDEAEMSAAEGEGAVTVVAEMEHGAQDDFPIESMRDDSALEIVTSAAATPEPSIPVPAPAPAPTPSPSPARELSPSPRLMAAPAGGGANSTAIGVGGVATGNATGAGAAGATASATAAVEVHHETGAAAAAVDDAPPLQGAEEAVVPSGEADEACGEPLAAAAATPPTGQFAPPPSAAAGSAAAAASASDGAAASAPEVEEGAASIKDVPIACQGVVGGGGVIPCLRETTLAQVGVMILEEFDEDQCARARQSHPTPPRPTPSPVAVMHH